MQIRTDSEGSSADVHVEGDQGRKVTATWHQKPDRAAIEQNKIKEPEGERIRAELEDFIRRNHIVGIMLDTDQHTVEIQINRLPPACKSVLTIWGSIYVRDYVTPVVRRLLGKDDKGQDSQP